MKEWSETFSCAIEIEIKRLNVLLFWSSPPLPFSAFVVHNDLRVKKMKERFFLWKSGEKKNRNLFHFPPLFGLLLLCQPAHFVPYFRKLLVPPLSLFVLISRAKVLTYSLFFSLYIFFTSHHIQNSDFRFHGTLLFSKKEKFLREFMFSNFSEFPEFGNKFLSFRFRLIFISLCRCYVVCWMALLRCCLRIVWRVLKKKNERKSENFPTFLHTHNPLHFPHSTNDFFFSPATFKY